MSHEFEHIHFIEKEKKTKTVVWSCFNNRSGDLLGEVRWYGPWRRYCYMPAGPTVYSSGCLSDIQEFIDGEMAERKSEAKKCSKD